MKFTNINPVRISINYCQCQNHTLSLYELHCDPPLYIVIPDRHYELHLRYVCRVCSVIMRRKQWVIQIYAMIIDGSFNINQPSIYNGRVSSPVNRNVFHDES